MSWVRSGYCCQCGQCCEHSGNPFEHGEEDPRRSITMKDRIAERLGACPLLTFNSTTGPTACLGHTGMVPEGEEDPYYMSGCNVWPTVPDHVKDFSSCTYTFEWVDDEPP